MSKTDLNLYSYENLLKNLISLLQSQVLSLASLHGIEKTWSFQFSSIYSHMKSIEDRRAQIANFSYLCKDLFNYINRNLTSQQSNRTRAISLENSAKRKTQRGKKPDSVTNSKFFNSITHQRNTSSSNYYSKVMNKVLAFGGRENVGNRARDEQDIWVLGDDIRFLV